MSDTNTAINTVSVDCPAKTNLTLHVGRPRSEWGGRHELDTIYCAVGVYDTVTTSRKKPGSGFSLNLEGAYLGDLASSGSDMRRNHAVLALFAMAEASGHEPDVALNIEKRIPVGAGMASAQRTGDRRSVAGRRQAGVRLRIRPFRNRIRANRRCGTRRAIGMATKPLRRPHHRHQGTGPSDCAYHRVTVRLKSTDFWRRTRT